MRQLRYVLCDVFTARPLTGNALAVFTDGRNLSARVMQDVAREMNLSETVFVLPRESKGHARIRIFTPAEELPFAGHPVLGAACVLGGPLQADVVELETGIGVIPVRLEREGAKIVFGWMRQRVPTWKQYEAPEALLAALGLPRSELPILEYDNGVCHAYVVAESPAAVAALAPNFALLKSLPPGAVNVAAGSGTAWKTRTFFRAPEVREDPATGSAAGPLAVHVARHGLAPFGSVLRIEQGTELERPAELSAIVHGSIDALEQVEVGGAAVLVGRGELRVT